MSFDIVAFDPAAATDEEFADWYQKHTSWEADRRYDDISVATPDLQAFYSKLIETYPPMNGPGAPTDDQIDADADLEARLTDYSIGTQLIYAGFAWSRESHATEAFTRLAAAHDVAVAFVSEDPVRIVRPGKKRRLGFFARRSA